MALALILRVLPVSDECDITSVNVRSLPAWQWNKYTGLFIYLDVNLGWFVTSRLLVCGHSKPIWSDNLCTHTPSEGSTARLAVHFIWINTLIISISWSNTLNGAMSVLSGVNSPSSHTSQCVSASACGFFHPYLGLGASWTNPSPSWMDVKYPKVWWTFFTLWDLWQLCFSKPMTCWFECTKSSQIPEGTHNLKLVGTWIIYSLKKLFILLKCWFWGFLSIKSRLMKE